MKKFGLIQEFEVGLTQKNQLKRVTVKDRKAK